MTIFILGRERIDGTARDSPPGSKKRSRKVTQAQYYCVKLSVRPSAHFCPLLWGKKLLHQFIIDAYLKIEGARLGYYRKNQSDMRVASYQTLHDYVANKALEEGKDVGAKTILPSSFIGGPRWMKQAYQDAMAIIGKLGKPHLFITFTCNPQWPEIRENLFVGQQPHDRPDLVARVYKQKLKELCEDIDKHHIFGIVIGRIHVIEFQKRGLPHAHILAVLRDEDAPKTAEDVDLIISAEIPDEKKFPRLYKIVTESMVHGPCGPGFPNAPCMADGKCSKEFPKRFVDETSLCVDGYPEYRRSFNGGKKYHIRYGKNGSMTKVVENSWVVPYSPYLCLKYEAHINVEIVSSVAAVKYLFKYVYKGHDCANIAFTTRINSTTGREEIVWDEVKSFMDTRYISAPEAIWRIFKYCLTHRSHSIQRLPVHLEDQHNIYFDPGEEEQALEAAEGKDSPLTAYFKLNQNNEAARKILYREIPEHFVWNTKNRKWTPRKRNPKDMIGRIYSVSPRDMERFCLRLLLLSVKGATSYENLRTVDGRCYTTFKGFLSF